MSNNSTKTARNACTRELNDFLADNIGNPATVWPRLQYGKRRDHPARRVGRTVCDLHVLVVGELALELPIEVDATRAELAGILRRGELPRAARPQFRQLRVGGFVGHAVEAAAKLGARVAVCTCVSVPTPARVEAFLEEYGVDRRFVTGVPGSASTQMVFCCKDGWVVPDSPGASAAQHIDVPAEAVREADAILVDPCALSGRSLAARRLSRCLRRSSGKLTVGLRLDQRTGPAGFLPARDKRVWTFLRRRDGLRLAGWDSVPGSEGRQLELVRRLHDRFRIARLVLQLGAEGAVMLNGLPCPYRVHTCPLSRAKFTAAGDTLLAVTTLASASGADDRTSLRRGVAAATGVVAGLDLPTSLEELDAE